MDRVDRCRAYWAFKHIIMTHRRHMTCAYCLEDYAKGGCVYSLSKIN